MKSWTQQQRVAIETVGQNLLVSAAAGSGKTSVLAERCVRLICDGESPCDIGDLLVVTFTEAAAAEMKSRIAKSLVDRQAISPNPHTARQLVMLDRANISTLHGFCARVLRQHFHLLGLDPEFQIIDADESSMLMLDTARQLFADRYDSEDAEGFRRLIDCYADGNDERIVQQVIGAYQTLCSVADPGEWLQRATKRIEQAIELPLPQSELGIAYIQHLAGQLASAMDECREAGVAIKAMQNFPDYVEYLRDIYRILDHWWKVLKSHGIDALAEEASDLELPRLKPVSSKVSGKDLAQSRLYAVRNTLQNGNWRQGLSFTTAQWKDGLQRTLPHAKTLLALVADFAERYAAVKNQDSALDFADLERLALRALNNSGSAEIASIAKTYHRQFKHVLVDEYQDINEVQDAILSLLSHERAGDDLPPNLFCVGDVKQSIYRFRLADPERFLLRENEYRAGNGRGLVVDLNENFRSRAPLLSAINGVFERLMTMESAGLAYDQTHRLRAGREFPDGQAGRCFSGAPIELHLLPKKPSTAGEGETDEEELEPSEFEAILLGKRILEMTNAAAPMQVIDRSGAESIARPVRYSDIAILLRSVKFKADIFVKVLRQMGIPVHSESSTGYFEAVEVNDVLSLLHILDNQRQDIPLTAVLRSPMAAMPDPESNLTRIRLACSGEPPVPFHLAVQKYAEEKTDDLSQWLRNFLGQLQRWRQIARQRPVAELLWTIYDQTGYLAFCGGLTNGEQRQANLIELHDRARQFATFRRQGLARFLGFLEQLKKDADLGQASITGEADNAVRILSVHKSKGLEFPVVLLPDLGKAINLQDCQGSILLDRKMGLGLQVVDEERQIRYPSLAFAVVQQRIRQQTMAEELRVLYVAMTRAQEHLILVGTCAETSVEKWRQRWKSHGGPIPAEAVLGARTPLDWLGSTAAALEGGDSEIIRMHMHTSEEVATWSLDDVRSPKMSAAQTAIAKLKPIEPAPPISAASQAVIDRLNWQYAFQTAANTAAAVSVTSLVKTKSEPVAPAVTATPLPSQSVDRVLARPVFLAGELPLDAADKGTATHAVLEQFDFTRSVDMPGIEAQIDELQRSRKLTSVMAGAVDLEAIHWFLQSKIGAMLRANPQKVRRELPIYFASPSNAGQAMDRVMVRGRIDLMLATNDGWLLVDYKTDRVQGEDIDRRAEFYAGQLQYYRDAVQRITGTPVAGAALVFLHPREIRRV